MRIVYFYTNFACMAGTERILIEKMNWLSAHGIDVIALTCEQGDHPFSFDLSEKVQHIDLNVRLFTLFKFNRLYRIYKERCMRKELYKRFNSFMEEYKPDIVITTTYEKNIIRAVAKCPFSCKRLIESHIDKRYVLSNYSLYIRHFLRNIHTMWKSQSIEKNVRQFDILIALNQADADEWSPYVNTKVITNMVRLNSEDRFSDGTSKHVIFVGRYVEQKGLFSLMKIWKLIHERHPDWHLDLYGDGEYRDRLIAEAEQQQINIHIHPPCGNVFEKYIESSIFVLTSIYEPFGLVIPEAMSCGLPVVSFDAEGPRHIITDGVDGFLVKNRNFDDFAGRVCQLIENKELRLQMGRQAIHSAQRYSAEQIMPQWIKLFDSLIDAKY